MNFITALFPKLLLSLQRATVKDWEKNCLTDLYSSDIRVLRGKAFLLFGLFQLLKNYKTVNKPG